MNYTLKRKRIGFNCAVKKCETKRDGRFSFFYFPKDPNKRKEWINKCGSSELYEKDDEFINKLRICAKHFEQKMFLNDLKNRLQPTAIPVLLIPKEIELSIFPKIIDSITAETCDAVPSCSKDPLTIKSSNSESDFMYGNVKCTQTETVQSSNTPKMRKLRAEIRNLNQKIRRLDTHYKELTKKQLENITVADFKVLCKKFLPPANAKFVQFQAELNQTPLNGSRYTDEYKKFALQLYSISPKAYRYVLKTFALPCVRSLQRFTSTHSLDLNL